MESEIKEIRRQESEIKEKIRELVNKDLGKVYFIEGSKFGDNLNAKQVIEEFKSMGVTVRPPQVEEIDLSIDYADELLNLATELKTLKDKERELLSEK